MARERHPGMSKVGPKTVEVVKSIPKAQLTDARIDELEFEIVGLKKLNKVFQKEVDIMKREQAKIHRLLKGLVDKK